MKILYLCHRFPFPPKRGGKIRPFNMIRHFGEGGHAVTVCSLARSPAEAREGEGIAPHCAGYEMAAVQDPVQALRMVARLPLATPSSMGFFYSRDLQRRVDRRLAREKYDLIFVHCSSVAQYVENVTGIPKILDFGDMDSQKWLEYARYKPFPLSLGYRLEGMKMEAAERRLARKFDLCTATTRAEWETLDGYGAARASDWFPNGVDAGYFQPDGGGYDPDTLSFIGRMDYYPNQECMFDFCRNTLPLIQARRPGAKLMIVGADPSPAVKKLGELPGVTVTGSVPDVRPHILRSAAMVATLNIARGTQNKILEAMAMAQPVITVHGCAEAISATPAQGLWVADSPEEWSQAIDRSLSSPQAHVQAGLNARHFVVEHFSWQAHLSGLDALWPQGVRP